MGWQCDEEVGFFKKRPCGGEVTVIRTFVETNRSKRVCQKYRVERCDRCRHKEVLADGDGHQWDTDREGMIFCKRCGGYNDEANYGRGRD